MARYGREVRLIAPRYVKPYIKAEEKRCCRCRGDCRGVAVATMPFVEPKLADQQASGGRVPHARAAREAAHRSSESAEVASPRVSPRRPSGQRIAVTADRRRLSWLRYLAEPPIRLCEDWATTFHRCVWLNNQQLPQSALESRSPLQAMKDWHKLKSKPFKKQPYYLPGCETL